MTHPPAPWRLRGQALVIPRGATSGLFLATYTGETLAYHELIVFRPGLVVSHIYVDDEQSLSGGHEIWGLPKELATFEYTRTHFVARQEQTLLSASIRRRPGKVPLAIPAPIVSDAGATLGRARIKAAPALVTLDVPPSSPFAHLGLSGTRPGLAGDDLELTMPAPRS